MKITTLYALGAEEDRATLVKLEGPCPVKKALESLRFVTGLGWEIMSKERGLDKTRNVILKGSLSFFKGI